MIKFREWLLKREMLSPVPFKAITAPQREKLGLVNALPSGEAKLSRWRSKMLKKGNQDGDWRQ